LSVEGLMRNEMNSDGERGKDKFHKMLGEDYRAKKIGNTTLLYEI